MCSERGGLQAMAHAMRAFHRGARSVRGMVGS
jgi:hypothetical protein